jgi:hypothetical protein
MDTATLLDTPRRRRLRIVPSLAFIFVIALTASLFVSSQSDSDNELKKISAQANLPNPIDYNVIWGNQFPNPNKDPNATIGDCDSLNINSILLIDRSMQYRNMFSTPELFETYKLGIKLYMMRISSAARARNAEAHIIIGAFGTYNVWQNTPANGVRNAAWRNSINIADPMNLIAQLEVIDNIHFVRTASDPAHNGDPQRGYLGGEAARLPITNFAEANIDDALVQAAREISRWTNGASSVGVNDDIDLVMTVTGGNPNVNNGPTNNKFPARNRVFRPAPVTIGYPILLSPDYYQWGAGPATGQAEDDTWRARETVNALRNGTAINYNDTRDNGSFLSDSSPAHRGARPPTRVFGEVILPGQGDADVMDEVYNMTRIFGWEWADYDFNPPQLAIGDATIIRESHRHFDKSYGAIEENEIVADMLLPIRDLLNPIGAPAPCPVNTAVDAPSLSIDIEDIDPIVEGTTGTATITITNTGNTLQNIEVFAGRGTANLVDNNVPHQTETTTRDVNCPYANFILPPLPCHYTQPEIKGKIYVPGAGSLQRETRDYLLPGAAMTFDVQIDAPVGSTITSDQLRVYVNATLDYDHTSTIAANVPIATFLPDGSLDPVRNGGFYWGTTSETIDFLSTPYPV